MPLYTYRCNSCGKDFEGLHKYDEMIPCQHCGAMSTGKVIGGAPSFRIKGFRAQNSYGRKFIDTPGINPKTGEENGYSFTSNKGGTLDHNSGNE